jgi:hypothetical protein
MPRNLSLGSSLYTAGRFNRTIIQAITQLDVMSMVDLPKLMARSGDEQIDWMRVGTVFKWPNSDPRRIFSAPNWSSYGEFNGSFHLLITRQ